MSPGDGEQGVEAAITELYRGPLEDFVSRRDALAKDLRSSGDRESAGVVKALRKPSRVAWALNLAVLESPGAMEGLVAAIRDAVAGQSPGADVRTAIGSLRSAAREFATEGARAAVGAGQKVEAGELAAALFAVLGDSESFEKLRRGRLVDVPEAGGLDLLNSLPALPREEATPAAKPASAAPPAASKKPVHKGTDSRGADLRARAEKAASALAAAKERADEAQAALREAEISVAAAEAKVRQAEAEAREARRRSDRAREKAEAAAADLEKARTELEKAEGRLRSR